MKEELIKCYCGHTTTCDCGTKQETLEEALINNGYHDKESNDLWKEGVEFGAKWQQERMYSEDEVLNILYKHTEDLLKGKKVTLEHWFEQFKKK